MQIDDEKLVAWFNIHKRDLPWRHTLDPYAIYVSEMMLQQTRVETVIPYYERFLKELPTIKDLAQVDEKRLLKLWEGLGYYSRARNLKTSAMMVMDEYDGVFPNCYEKIIRLKGVGEYSAGAILSRAFQLPYAAIDGNALRVLSRLNEDPSDISLNQTKQKYKAFIEKKTIKDYGAFNEALMELGATICTFKNAKCEVCPLNQSCLAYQHQSVDQFPINEKKIVKKSLVYTCVFIGDLSQKYYFKEKESGVLKGLYAPILKEGHLTSKEVLDLFDQKKVVKIECLEAKKHVFTHQVWNMIGYLIILDVKDENDFYSIEKIKKQMNIPICFQKFFTELGIK